MKKKIIIVVVLLMISKVIYVNYYVHEWVKLQDMKNALGKEYVKTGNDSAWKQWELLDKKQKQEPFCGTQYDRYLVFHF